MKIYEKELFHIHRNNFHTEHWIPNACICTPQQGYNYFYEGLISEPHRKISANLEQYDLIKYLGDNVDKFYDFNNTLELTELTDDSIFDIKEFNSHILSLLDKTFDSLLYSRKVLRETIFENVREKSYPDLPSRKKCFWLSEMENIEVWWNDFKHKEDKSIFKVIATGNIFKADGAHIQLDVFKLSDFVDSAELYWKGIADPSQSILPELIFEGELKIISQYENPSQI